jgi:hypothetical protein
MLAWLASTALGAITGPLLNAYKARLAATNTTDKLAVDLALADISAERDRRNAQRDMGIMAMNHWLWWVAWGLFVIPVGIHHAAVYAVSILGITPDVLVILAVPEAERLRGDAIVQAIFLLQSGAGIAGTLIKRFAR